MRTTIQQPDSELSHAQLSNRTSPQDVRRDVQAYNSELANFKNAVSKLQTSLEAAKTVGISSKGMPSHIQTEWREMNSSAGKLVNYFKAIASGASDLYGESNVHIKFAADGSISSWGKG